MWQVCNRSLSEHVMSRAGISTSSDVVEQVQDIQDCFKHVAVLLLAKGR